MARCIQSGERKKKKKKLQTRILYLSRLSLIFEEEINNFIDKQKAKGLLKHKAGFTKKKC